MNKLEAMWMDGLLGRGQVHVQSVWSVPGFQKVRSKPVTMLGRSRKNPSRFLGGSLKTRHDSGEVEKNPSRFWGSPKKTRRDSGEVKKKTVVIPGRSKKTRRVSSVSSLTRFMTGGHRSRGWESWFCLNV